MKRTMSLMGVCCCLAMMVMAVLGPAWIAGAQSPAEEIRRGSLVLGIDTDSLLEMRLAGYEVLRRSAVWQAGLKLVLVEPGTRNRLELTIGVHESPEEAREASLVLLDDVSVKCREGSLAGTPLGEKAWSLGGSPETGAGEAAEAGMVIFCRRNVLVRVVGPSATLVQNLAERIDNDLLTDRSFIVRGTDLRRPIFDSVLSPAAVTMGEEIEIGLTVSADPGRDLFYAYSSPGGVLLGGDPPTRLIYRPHTEGRQLIGFFVVDDRCVVSPIMEIPVRVEERE